MQKERAKAVTETDWLVQFVAKVLVFAKANRQKVVLGISGVVLLLVVLSGAELYGQKVNRDTSQAFQALKIDFQRLVESQGRDLALKQWLEDSPSVLGEINGRASSFEAVLLWYAGLAFEAGDFESASTWYGIAAKGFRADSSLKNIAWCGQGSSLEQQGNSNDAVSFYEKIRKSDSSVKRYEATFHLARIKEAQGDTLMAKVLYSEIIEGNAPSYYKKLSEEKVDGL